MSDFREQDALDENEVEIVDLGAPDKGISRYLFVLREKWFATTSPRIKLVMTVFVLGLLVAILQTGSSSLNAPPSVHSRSYQFECAVIIIVLTPGQTINPPRASSQYTISGSQESYKTCSSGATSSTP